jgi:mgtE-like transporter
LPALFLASFIPRGDLLNALVAAGCVALAAIALVAGVRAERVTRRILAEMAGVIVLVPLLDIFAGALLEARRTSLELVPAVLILIPPFVSQAGALGGILSSRLSSKLQLGVITPRGRPEPPAIVDGAIVVGFGLVVFTAIGAIAVALENLTGLAEGAGLLHPSGASIVAGTLLAGLLVLPVTLVAGYYVAVVTTRFGLDPDNQGVPIITSLMDLVGVAAIVFAMGVSGVIVHG